TPPPADGGDEGLSWSWHLDIETLLAALAEPAPWNRAPRTVACPAAPAPSADAEPAGASSAAAKPSESQPPGSQPPGSQPPASQPPDEGSAGARPVDASLPAGVIDPVEADFADYLDAVDCGRSSVVSLPAAAG